MPLPVISIPIDETQNYLRNVTLSSMPGVRVEIMNNTGGSATATVSTLPTANNLP